VGDPNDVVTFDVTTKEIPKRELRVQYRHILYSWRWCCWVTTKEIPKRELRGWINTHLEAR
jgi:hypothetical protein